MRARLTSLIVVVLMAGQAAACPFCAAVKLTFHEEIRGSQAAILAKLRKAEPPAGDAKSPEPAPAEPKPSTFDVAHVFKGEELLGGAKTVDVLYFGANEPSQTYLLIGVKDPTLGVQWGAPTGLSSEAEAYVRKLMELPDNRVERLPHVFPYLQHPELVINQDAYDEFAMASYGEIKQLKPHLDRAQLAQWIRDPNTSASRKRLFLTLLGVAGTEEDIPMLEEMIRSEDREQRRALDALVACYLTLKGPEGLALIDELFLKNPNAEYTDTYATIMALRFHGQEGGVIPQERLVESMRLMLDRPKLADLVIADLARWEDWSVIDRLSTLFAEANEESNWVRVPVLQYLKACPKPEAKEAFDRLAKLDPDAAKRAASFLPIADKGPTPNETRAGAAANVAAASGPATTPAPSATPPATSPASPASAPPAVANAPPSTAPAPLASPVAATPAEALRRSSWGVAAVPLTTGVALLVLAVVTYLFLAGGRGKSSG